jgi:DNA-binding NarL/FixJ family response regulator
VAVDDAELLAVAVIDHQPITRAGMERVVAEQPQFVVAASVGSIDQLDPPPRGYDVAVLALPPQDPDTWAGTVSSLSMIARPLVVSSWERPNAVTDTIRAGARGCVTRHSDQDEVLTALRTLARGGIYVCADLADRFQAEVTSATPDETTGLAPREIETVRWIALGFTQSQIATRMGLSQATVNTYAKRIRSKLHVNNKADLTRIAIRLGYLVDDGRTSAA